MTSQIEKIARLMGFELAESLTNETPHFHPSGSLYVWRTDKPDLIMPQWFNPLTNKADLMDVECALGIDVLHDEEYITAEYWKHGLLEFDDKKRIANYAHNKFTACATAVCAVAEQIYDKGQA